MKRSESRRRRGSMVAEQNAEEFVKNYVQRGGE
ncbi:MAG: ubiquitin-like protein Pup [Candidatus Rokubacteria bacterium]|nr:ubiquitin-like protein Pup [Candidatus Rokubacteria bacterium]